VLTPVWQRDHWRVKLKWRNRTPRYFGAFQSKEEAEKWIERHRWLTTQPQESGADPEAVDDLC
jgi:hypothetical protein